jgi:SanA protein
MTGKWLRRLGISGLAVVLVIAAMVDYCLSTPKELLAQLAILLGCVAMVALLPSRARWLRFLRDLLVALLPAFLAVVAYANATAIWASRGRIFAEVSQIPATKVGLVFGTSNRVAGRENLYFRFRIEAATQVWNAGKVETLIVSGDKSSRYYNEPEKMKRALIDRGIPANRIVLDVGGFRTLDSVVRAKEIFSTDSILFISQRFQNERAIYLAKANGIAAFGFDARDVESHDGLKTKIREVGARVKMWLDVNFLNTRPHLLGDKIDLPE